MTTRTVTSAGTTQHTRRVRENAASSLRSNSSASFWMSRATSRRAAATGSIVSLALTDRCGLERGATGPCSRSLPQHRLLDRLGGHGHPDLLGDPQGPLAGALEVL